MRKDQQRLNCNERKKEGNDRPYMYKKSKLIAPAIEIKLK